MGERLKEQMGETACELASTSTVKKLKLKFALSYDTKAQRGVEVQLRSFFNLEARCGWVVNATPRPLYRQERDPVPILYEAGWAPGPV